MTFFFSGQIPWALVQEQVAPVSLSSGVPVCQFENSAYLHSNPALLSQITWREFGLYHLERSASLRTEQLSMAFGSTGLTLLADSLLQNEQLIYYAGYLEIAKGFQTSFGGVGISVGAGLGYASQLSWVVSAGLGYLQFLSPNLVFAAGLLGIGWPAPPCLDLGVLYIIKKVKLGAQLRISSIAWPSLQAGFVFEPFKFLKLAASYSYTLFDPGFGKVFGGVALKYRERTMEYRIEGEVEWSLYSLSFRLGTGFIF